MFNKFKVKMDNKKSIGKVFNPLPPIVPETTEAEIKKVDGDAGKNNRDESNQDTVSKSTPLPPIESESSTKQENEEEELGAESEEEDEEYAQSLYENVGKIKQKSVEEVMEDLKSVVFPRLSKYRRFNSKAALYDVWFVSSACSRFYGDTGNYVKVAEQITSLKFVEFIQKLLKKNFERLFDSNYLNWHLLTQAVSITLSLMWNMSDKSVAFVESILDHNLPLDLFKYMQTEHLLPGRMAESKSSRLVQPFIGTLHNVVQKAPEAKQVLRACGAVELLQPFRECNNEKISCVSLMVQAYLVTEEENERLNSNSEVFEYLIKHLDASMQNTSIDGLRFAAIEIVDVINRLAANDNNKRLIVDSGALEYYAKLMDPDWTDEGKPGEEDVVRAEVAHGLWILAFKCKDDILKHAECIKGLEYLANSSAEEVRKNAEGALWILKAVKSSATSEAQTKHIFFSYQRDNLDAVSRINTRLKESGFKTWIDIDDMSNSDSCLEGMAIAVENASMVIICYSEKYKDSANCRTEAEYAFRLKKPVIPLRFQTGYYPDGWLGILIGSKLVYDCSPIKFEDSVKNLIKELHRLTSTTSLDSVDGLEKKPMQPSHERSNPVSTWNKEAVDKWIEKNNLSHMKDWLSAYNGDMLLQFQRMKDRAPEAFYAYFIQNKFPLLDAFAISKALDDLT